MMIHYEKKKVKVNYLFRLIFENMSSDDLSLCDIIMPNVYIRLLIVYDHYIDNLENLLNEYLELYCPQAFKCIIYDNDKMLNGQIIDCQNNEKRKIFSREFKMNENISKYIDNNDLIEDLFPYSIIPTDLSPLIFIHHIHFKDGTILSFGCHHYLSDGHGFSLLGQRFSIWLKEKKSIFLWS